MGVEDVFFRDDTRLIFEPITKGFEDVLLGTGVGEIAEFIEVSLFFTIDCGLRGGSSCWLQMSSLQAWDCLDLTKSESVVPDEEALEMRRSRFAHFSSDNCIGGVSGDGFDKRIILSVGIVVESGNPTLDSCGTGSLCERHDEKLWYGTETEVGNTEPPRFFTRPVTLTF